MILSFNFFNYPYRIRIKKHVFRKKEIFSDMVSSYEKMLLSEDAAFLDLNTGNMIYVMMKRLPFGAWNKQNLLVASYRDLVFKMSYVDVVLTKDDSGYLNFCGRKEDVFWAFSFISQAYPEDSFVCEDMTRNDEFSIFTIRNGSFVGKNALKLSQTVGCLFNIWDEKMYESKYFKDSKSALFGVYDARHKPNSGERFVSFDGRFADYVKMDERYYIRDTQGRNVSEITRHNISVSLIKDFEDMVSNQTVMPYDLYQMRYVAFMNKVHELEYLMGGLEISCYNMLPIAERGLPFALPETIQRTNCCDFNSLKYIKDRIKDKILSTNDVSYYMKAIAKSVISRIDGYDVEYRTYQYTGCSEEACFVVRNKSCEELYKDVVEIEWLKKIPLTVSTYKALLNEPKGSVY